MKRLVFLFVMAPVFFVHAQKIGKMAPEKGPEIFPPNSWGVDVMFGEGGFGLGTFYRRDLSQNLTAFTDISIAESKDDREIEYIDYYGNSYVFNKKNRVFLVPLNFGLMYRLFAERLTDNLRPYINFGVGPSLVITTPYLMDNQQVDFFESFKWAKADYALGGYVGIGANFGISKNNLIGLNARYYYMHLFGKGIENYETKFRKDLSDFRITLNIGIMY